MELGTLTTSRLRRTRIRRSSQNPINAELPRIPIPGTSVNRDEMARCTLRPMTPHLATMIIAADSARSYMTPSNASGRVFEWAP